MRRLASLLALAAALAVPPTAMAGAPTFKGKLTGGGRVAFELKRNERGVRKVENWRWHDLRITCKSKPGQTFQHDGRFRDYVMQVSERHFYAQLTSTEPPLNSVTVDGSFPTDWRHAEGTIQLSGDTHWGDYCSSGGPINWTATKI